MPARLRAALEGPAHEGSDLDAGPGQVAARAVRGRMSDPREALREARLRPAADDEPACAMCGGPWRDLGHCKGVCLRCGYLQSCVDT